VHNAPISKLTLLLPKTDKKGDKMPRVFDEKAFDAVYEEFVCSNQIQRDGVSYHRRYKSRYKTCAMLFAKIAPQEPVDVLDIGVGQLALICHKLWGDRAAVADLPGECLNYMSKNGVDVHQWNLCASEAPFDRKFNIVFFSEVIEHLPVPGYIPLSRIKKVLKTGGAVICTTPNLYRLRNIVYMVLGKKIFDYFRYPDGNKGMSHVLEYSREHLQWQFEQAAFDCQVDYHLMHHVPTKPLNKFLAVLGYPLYCVPKWRDSLVAVAYCTEGICSQPFEVGCADS